MGIEERDPHTGYLTTGHEWNGIRELNTPVPRAVYLFLAAAVLFAIGYWLLMPAWPLGATYTRGLLGVDQRSDVQRALARAAQDRAAWTRRIEAEHYADIQADAGLMNAVRRTGPALFGDNCAACHGADARGGPGFPGLVDAATLWGKAPETLAETIRAGINSTHPDSRVSQMPAFGRYGLLTQEQIENVSAYVRTLAGADVLTETAKVQDGQAIFATRCAACHGAEGGGNPLLGAPDLADRSWIYGGDAQTIHATVWGGRQGRMPAWEQRLSPVERKILALYLADLGAARP